MTKNTKQFWAIIPAAGVGKRMLADRPKQYLQLQNKTVIEHSLNRLLDHPAIKGAVVALDENDEYWQNLNFMHTKPVLKTTGGEERCDTVLNALFALSSHLESQDQSNVWVLVHDAARPCLREEDITKLINVASDNDNGGLLAFPVRDTMKKAIEIPVEEITEAGNNTNKNNPENISKVQTTIDRTALWHALTPQMFKLPLLISALQSAAEKKLHVTDDASAMELAGYNPLLVEGCEDNIKITRPFDLKLAALYMQNQLR